MTEPPELVPPDPLALPVFTVSPIEPQKKFQHGLALRPVALFVLTALTTTFAFGSIWYAFAILLILGAHEFGHYFACRWHNVDCTLPYFLPMPFVLTGTLGAVIKIKEPFPSRAALFDIGVAGPIAGFITLLPFMIAGIFLSDVTPLPDDPGTLLLGEPLLFKAITHLVYGSLPEGMDLVIHPMGFAAWFGMLATALNLLPFGQLDGGHIAYSLLGRRATVLSKVALATVMVLAVVSFSWIAMAVMLSIMAWFMGIRHPAPWDDTTPLTFGRKVVAAIAVLIFIGCFTPVPITISW